MLASCRQLLCCLAMSLLFIASAAAHPARMVNATARIEADGTYRLVMNFDLPAYLLNESAVNASDSAMNALLDASSPELEKELREARQRLLADMIVKVDGVDAPPSSIELPSLSQVRELSHLSPRLPLMADATVKGRFPSDAAIVCFRFPEVIGDVVLTIEQPGLEPSAEPVPAGQFSSSIPVRFRTATSSVERVAPGPPQGSSGAFFATSIQFLHWGFTHILPHGIDHILFVLGLFLLSDKLKPLILQVTAFTAAHSLTLALSMLDLISLPEWVVEPIIAASIAFIAIENLFTRELKPWRPFVVFGFGLVHGLGFAGILREAHLPAGQFLNAIVSFNIGVELGQIAVIAGAMVLVGWFRGHPRYRAAVSIPASVLIAVIAIGWTIERVAAGV